METNFIPLSGRIEFYHAYVMTSDEQERQEDRIDRSSSTRLQRARLATQEATYPYFTGKKTLIGHTVDDLKGEKIDPWNKIVDVKIIFMSKKAMQVALKKILRELEWERFYESLQECRMKLKDNFRQFYLKIQEKQELKRSQLKNQI